MVPQVRKPASEAIKAEIGESLSATYSGKYGVLQLKCLSEKLTHICIV